MFKVREYALNTLRHILKSELNQFTDQSFSTETKNNNDPHHPAVVSFILEIKKLT